MIIPVPCNSNICKGTERSFYQCGTIGVAGCPTYHVVYGCESCHFRVVTPGSGTCVCPTEMVSPPYGKVLTRSALRLEPLPKFYQKQKRDWRKMKYRPQYLKRGEHYDY